MMTEIDQAPINKLISKVKHLIVFFIVGLVLSGVTAFPILSQLSIAHKIISQNHWSGSFANWIEKVYNGVVDANTRYPFLAYGTDWLAFAHLGIAVAFIGPLKDPIKNIWVIEFGLICCVGIFPLALIAGEARGIPIFWRLIDCSFGLFGGIVLYFCRKMIKQLEKIKIETQ